LIKDDLNLGVRIMLDLYRS